MIFEKLDDKTVRCILTEEDMIEHDVKIEDFFTNQEKTRDFLADVVRLAQDEVGYEANGDTLAMQVMPLPENRLAITFSEKAENAINHMIGNIKSALETIKNGDIDQMLESISEEYDMKQDKKEEKSSKKKGEKKGKKTFFRVFRFDNLEGVEQFCSTVPEDLNVKSQLYKDKKTECYYLVVEKGRLSVKNLEKVCFFATDFSTLVSTQESYIAYCKEHYKCIIKKGAVRVMAELAIKY